MGAGCRVARWSGLRRRPSAPVGHLSGAAGPGSRPPPACPILRLAPPPVLLLCFCCRDCRAHDEPRGHVLQAHQGGDHRWVGSGWVVAPLARRWWSGGGPLGVHIEGGRVGGPAPPPPRPSPLLHPPPPAPPASTHPPEPAAEVKGIKDWMVETCGVPADKFRGYRCECVGWGWGGSAGLRTREGECDACTVWHLLAPPPATPHPRACNPPPPARPALPRHPLPSPRRLQPRSWCTTRCCARCSRSRATSTTPPSWSPSRCVACSGCLVGVCLLQAACLLQEGPGAPGSRGVAGAKRCGRQGADGTALPP